jgi:hypothetical protein
MDKKRLKFVFIIPAFIGLCLMANVPNFSEQKTEKNVWLTTEDEIAIDKTIHDFGKLNESDGVVNATFTLTNNTKSPIVIVNATPSCGCTVATWTREPVDPGKTGHIVASYDPKGRPGPFDKTVTIATTGNPERIVVRIKGTVE